MSRTTFRTAQEGSPARASAQDPGRHADRVIGPGPTWRVAGALARLEGRKLTRHPAFLAGVGFALLGAAFFVVASVRLPAVSWDEDGWTVFVGFGMLGLLTMVAANFATLRDRREHTEEQHDCLAAVEPAKTGGLLLASVWPAFLSAVLLAAVAAYAGTVVSFKDYEVLHLAERVLVVGMLGTLGIAIARWIPNPFAAPLVAWGLLFATPSESPSTWHVLSVFSGIESLELAGWRIAYVVGLTALFCAAALLRRRLRLSFVVAGMLGLAVVTVSIVFLLPRACPSVGRCLL